MSGIPLQARALRCLNDHGHKEKKRTMSVRKMLKPLCLLLFVLAIRHVAGGVVDRVEPPFWWTGMRHDTLQLLMHGDSIGRCDPAIGDGSVRLINVYRTPNPNYMFLDIHIPEHTQPGGFNIILRSDGKVVDEVSYELRERRQGSDGRSGFTPADVIYLLMPDRFANGDTANDNRPGMREGVDRWNPDGRHGGDIAGIIGHLDYL
ncbi:MAG: cyclomaltodextrinase N-terminal domain-containing protein, partial [Bacteroidales bacterium]|nr:cyclomaltodextrinase N-terminal domain-containing protein [Bacteroidales bacterium]